MFFDRAINRGINHAHERALCIAHKDTRHGFGLLLEQTNSMSVHKRGIQLKVIEVYKAKSDQQRRGEGGKGKRTKQREREEAEGRRGGGERRRGEEKGKIATNHEFTSTKTRFAIYDT